MLEAEKVKAELAEIAKIEAAEKEALDMVQKASEAELRRNLVGLLTAEPTTGSVINIAFRLPSGARLTRNFRQEEPIKVTDIHIAHVLVLILTKRPRVSI